jgi:adenine C2-methylase RlmN of 23S rRNA A2503 and tRNA A37
MFIKNQDNTVFKFIDRGGLETIIKSVDKISQKTTIFVPSSIGCGLSCKYCHLSIKKYDYKSVTVQEIYTNVLTAFKEACRHNNSIIGKPIKIAFMGMGEPLLSFEQTQNVTEQLLEKLEDYLQKPYTQFLDRVDISTTFPKAFVHYNNLKDFLDKYPSKLFYSVFSSDLETRKFMMPGTVQPNTILPILSELSIPVNLHYILIQGVNDGFYDVSRVIILANKYLVDSLRVLRYNDCNESWFYESENYPVIIKYIRENVKTFLKEQESPGKEVKAACGMFG